MTITKVSYGKTYNIGQYQSERIDLEASIDETQESVIDAVYQLREYCDQLHKKNNPHLYQETTPLYNAKEDFPPVPLPEPEEKITPETGRKHTILEIQKCTTEKELANWKLIAYLHPETKEAFDNRLKELSK